MHLNHFSRVSFFKEVKNNKTLLQKKTSPALKPVRSFCIPINLSLLHFYIIRQIVISDDSNVCTTYCSILYWSAFQMSAIPTYQNDFRPTVGFC